MHACSLCDKGVTYKAVKGPDVIDHLACREMSSKGTEDVDLGQLPVGPDQLQESDQDGQQEEEYEKEAEKDYKEEKVFARRG